MQNAEKLSREQMEASQEIQFEGRDREEMYRWITPTLAQAIPGAGQTDARVAASVHQETDRRSRTQVTRLVVRYMEHCEVKQAVYHRHRFASRFTRADVESSRKAMEFWIFGSGTSAQRRVLR